MAFGMDTIRTYSGEMVSELNNSSHVQIRLNIARRRLPHPQDRLLGQSVGIYQNEFLSRAIGSQHLLESVPIRADGSSPILFIPSSPPSTTTGLSNNTAKNIREFTTQLQRLSGLQ